mgnify:CR=1 FL=1
MKKTIAVLGSTGSIGTQTLHIAENDPDSTGIPEWEACTAQTRPGQSSSVAFVFAAPQACPRRES